MRAFLVRLVSAAAVMLLLLASESNAVPSYARQTNFACNTCHYLFPELNSFGRMFKLHGYTTIGSDVVQATDKDGRTSLNLLKTPPLSGMLQATYNHLNTSLPGTQNNDVNFPEQLSFFFAGQVTPHFGAFVQFTYAVEGAAFNLDLVDVRFADQTELASKELVYGATLNDNPTIQDVWNSTPIWGFPYATSSITPGPIASTLIDGGLERQAAGLGAYILWDNFIYAEADAYRAAQQGGPHPPDQTSTMVIKNIAPYWRVVLQKQWPERYFSVGTYGISARLFDSGVGGPVDKFDDMAFDFQYEQPLGGGNFTAHGTYIHEKQTIQVPIIVPSEERTLKLNTMRVDANYYFQRYIGLGVGYFSTTGTEDQDIYSPDPVFGSRIGKPNTSGGIAELDFVPWLNTKFTLQYVMYDKFNGASKDYDGFGRNASDNNTLYLLSWFAM